MSAPRFYCDAPLAAGTRIALPEALAHHALRVLRLKAGETVVLFNGQGGEYPAVLDIDGKAGFAQPGDFNPHEPNWQAASRWCRVCPPVTRWTG